MLRLLHSYGVTFVNLDNNEFYNRLEGKVRRDFMARLNDTRLKFSLCDDGNKYVDNENTLLLEEYYLANNSMWKSPESSRKVSNHVDHYRLLRMGSNSSED